AFAGFNPDGERIGAIDDGVEGDGHVLDRKVAIERRVGNAVHERDCGTVAAAFEAFEVVVGDGVAWADDAHTARTGDAVAKEEVAVHQAVASMAKCKLAVVTPK